MTLLIIQLIRLETNGVVFIGAASTKTKKRAILIAQIALAIVAVACAAWLVVKAVGYNQAQLVYREMQAAYADDLGSGFDPDAGVNFDELKQKYPDVVGWLKMDDLDISYPIVQTTDNDHYLNYDAAGAPSIDGAIFLDYRNNSFADDLHEVVGLTNPLYVLLRESRHRAYFAPGAFCGSCTSSGSGSLATGAFCGSGTSSISSASKPSSFITS